MTDASVSVVVPVQNEQATIRALLDSLLNQTRPAGEIIVVDAGSDDRTQQIVREYAQAVVPVRLIRSGRVFPGTARNIGAERARLEYIAFTDAGITLDASWLEQLTSALDQPAPMDAALGNYCPVTSTFFTKCAATAYVSTKSDGERGNIRGPSIASCLIRKSVFTALGGFPPYRAAEDLIFLEKLMHSKYTVAYAAGAVAYWQLAGGWCATYRRFTVYSYHNLIAGRGRYWHHGVARLYLLALPFLMLSCFKDAWWLVVPAIGCCARTALTIWRKRDEQWGNSFSPFRWITVGSILLLLDVATFSGLAWWGWNKLLNRLPRPLQADEKGLV